ncbi:aminotransferase class IV [Actinoplanes sp. N902-109]|uniref:aminotransferase class IV n=1 Tax=Actinoplanes sp. (strain N902-109) TaxID=649831 RepID=UPI00059FFC26|nr:aminotransferase class IV [Actinoplanes sp. N902-109]
MALLDGRPATVGELQALALTNYGHFTTFRVDDGRVRGLELHLSRLVHDCRALFAADLDVDLVRRFLRLATVGRPDCTVRVTVFDPALDLGHPGAAMEPHVLITRRTASPARPRALTVQTVHHERPAPDIKSVGLFASLRLRRAAQLTGYDDALFIDDDAHVTEGATWNIGLVSGADILWPRAPQLPGVTMQLLQAARVHRVAPIALADISSMTAAFATNSVLGVRAVAAIDDVSFPAGHPVLDLLRDDYAGVPRTTI